MADIPVRHTERPTPAVRGRDPFEAFDQVFDRMLGGGLTPFGGMRRTPAWSEWLAGLRAPRVDVQERDEALLVRAEVPGVSKDDLDISLDEGRLTLHGRVQHEDEQREGIWYQCEIGAGEFQRTIELPASVETDQATARFESGVVEIRLPKAAGQQRRRIPIEG